MTKMMRSPHAICRNFTRPSRTARRCSNDTVSTMYLSTIHRLPNGSGAQLRGRFRVPKRLSHPSAEAQGAEAPSQCRAASAAASSWAARRLLQPTLDVLLDCSAASKPNCGRCRKQCYASDCAESLLPTGSRNGCRHILPHNLRHLYAVDSDRRCFAGRSISRQT